MPGWETCCEKLGAVGRGVSEASRVLTLWFVWVLTPQYSDGDTILVNKHRPSDETLNRGPDSLWSLKIPWHFRKE